jgi:hypothetical protein
MHLEIDEKIFMSEAFKLINDLAAAVTECCAC